MTSGLLKHGWGGVEEATLIGTPPLSHWPVDRGTCLSLRGGWPVFNRYLGSDLEARQLFWSKRNTASTRHTARFCDGLGKFKNYTDVFWRGFFAQQQRRDGCFAAHWLRCFNCVGSRGMRRWVGIANAIDRGIDGAWVGVRKSSWDFSIKKVMFFVQNYKKNETIDRAPLAAFKETNKICEFLCKRQFRLNWETLKKTRGFERKTLIRRLHLLARWTLGSMQGIRYLLGEKK